MNFSQHKKGQHMSETKFKVGDRVRVLADEDGYFAPGSEDGYFAPGSEGAVTEVENDALPYLVRFPSPGIRGTHEQWFTASELEPAGFKAGDRVRVVEPFELYGLLLNAEHTITAVEDDAEPLVNVNGITHQFFASRFVLATPTKFTDGREKFKIGDRFRTKRGYEHTITAVSQDPEVRFPLRYTGADGQEDGYMPVSVELVPVPAATESPAENKYARIAQDVAALVVAKQSAYGDSFSKSGDVMRILYPNGVLPEQMDDALTVVRILDKLFRLSTSKDAFGESPYLDLMGYSLLGAARDAK